MTEALAGSLVVVVVVVLAEVVAVAVTAAVDVGGAMAVSTDGRSISRN